MEEITRDIVILGGGIGGTIAALSAAKMGKKVVLTEETDWIGGQLTAQAVPPDEHKWIEEFGCTRTYREFRNSIRDFYLQHYPVSESVKEHKQLNPGNAWVTRIAHEPLVSLHVLNHMLTPYISSGMIILLLCTKPVKAQLKGNGDFIDYVLVEHLSSGEWTKLNGKFFIDATECGDLLPLVHAEYVMGAEAKSETEEPHARDDGPLPLDMQPITHVAAVDYIEDGNYTIEKPEQYEFWRHYRPEFFSHNQLSWYGPDAETGKAKRFSMFPGEGISLWDYRRIIDSSLFKTGFYEGDITLINWPQNDYMLGPIYGVSEEERKKHLEGARQLTLSLIYWLQTEAPRPDGGRGYPGIRLRGDVVGTRDGLAKHPYIRESRRIKALTTVKEQDINAELREGMKRWHNSVGIGAYRIDLHPTTLTHQLFYAPSYPFEIPLGSLIPVRMKNLIAAGKNIGSTHITNGCFRVHPVEWNIGESAGFLAAFCAEYTLIPFDINYDTEKLKDFQALLIKQGIELHWPDKVDIL
ncbi:FAD dependent oxidoreductase [Melghiribacillus thermohalophilus]|uniref:FAD dependent oxidoreductase n=1 Tax=Melghiribacillus thermohalophilus TaxID=1324956 RepID=A0A4R3N0Q7_9BACI|nr:FAD-dependent oxidoreductase [Melghiribacillus thermohalophilus]TCT21757.1 FAD dependent oxidoreductase [Melghiribacillus thermohalophilus]